MSGKPDIRSYCNPLPPRFSEKAQVEKLTGELYIEDRTGRMIDALIQSLRKGSIVEVVETFLLAPVRGRSDKRRRLLAKRLERIKCSGGKVIERATGWCSTRHLPSMLNRAYEQIAYSGKVRKHDRPGRPRKERTPDELAVMKAEYFSRKNATEVDARLAMKNRGVRNVTRGELYRLFGPRN